MPGTELFDSLYDTGRIKLDRRYFAHILQGGDLVPAVSHGEEITRLKMIKWKFRMYFTFYGTRNERKPKTGLFANLYRAASGLFSDSHDSKLQTVFRNGMRGLWTTIRLAPTAGWLSRADEQRMFQAWDGIYRRIRRELKSRQLLLDSPRDTTAIHESNVMHRLRPLHENSRTIGEEPESPKDPDAPLVVATAEPRV